MIAIERTIEGEITKSFINYMPIEDREIASSILYGVPSSLIEGIIVGGNVLKDKEKIAYLIEKFPNSYIASTDGGLIYEPKKKEYDSEVVIELRRQAEELERDKRVVYKKMMQYEKEIGSMKELNDKLMRLMILNCKNKEIINILTLLGWQGDISNKYVESMRNEYKSK